MRITISDFVINNGNKYLQLYETAAKRQQRQIAKNTRNVLSFIPSNKLVFV